MSKTHTTILEETSPYSLEVVLTSLHATYPPFVPPFKPVETVNDVLNTFGYANRFEAIWPPDNTETDRTRWNSFQHFSCRSGPDPSGVVLGGRVSVGSFNYYYNFAEYIPAGNYALYGGEFGRAGFLDSGLPEWYSSVDASNIVLPPVDLDEQIQRSLRSLLPLIRSELSVLNSIYELKDFKTLPRTIRNIERVTRNLSRRLRQSFRSGRKTLRQLLHASADGYLQSQFNLLPLLSDITGIFRAIRRTEKRINDFVSRAGKVQHRHFRTELLSGSSTQISSTSSSPAESFLNGSGVAVEYERNVSTDPYTFHAEIEYNFNYTRYQLEHARVLALLDAVGVNFNPVIIWNAIPWSFVVDWVLGVNTWLGQQRIGNMDPKINILRYLWSTKRFRRILVNRRSFIAKSNPNPELGIVTSGFVPLPVVHQSAYRREVGLPPASSFHTSGLSAEELSLGAALVITRRHEPNHKPLWKTQSSYP
jgi:hypothetical protein